MKLDPMQIAFSQLLISGTLVHEADFSELQKCYGIHIHPGLVMVVSMDRYPDLVSVKPREWCQQVGHQLVDVIKQTVTFPYTAIWTEEGVIALLIDVSNVIREEGDFTKCILRTAKAIQQSIVLAGITVSVGIGSYYGDPCLLHYSYREAVQSMNGRFFQGNQLVFQYGKGNQQGEVWEDPLAAAKAEAIALVRIGDEQGVHAHLRSLFSQMAGLCQHNDDLFKSQVVDLIIMMSRAVVEAGVNASVVLTRNVHFIQELYTTIRYDKFIQKVLDYVHWLTLQAWQTNLPNVSPLIRKVILYMKQNHLDSISLDDVARYSCLSKYHLSHLFKKEVGVGVVDYVNQIRIEKALFYIQTTDLPIKQVASQVGFQDPNYFSRMFKKYTGRSPKEYRIATSC